MSYSGLIRYHSATLKNKYRMFIFNHVTKVTDASHNKTDSVITRPDPASMNTVQRGEC
jgi:hypothetical protein